MHFILAKSSCWTCIVYMFSYMCVGIWKETLCFVRKLVPHHKCPHPSYQNYICHLTFKGLSDVIKYLEMGQFWIVAVMRRLISSSRSLWGREESKRCRERIRALVWVPKAGRVEDSCPHTSRSIAQEDQEFKVILSCIASSKLAWVTWDPVSKKKRK